MQLHQITDGPRKNRFCGPSALSAITGRQTDFTAAFLRLISGKRQITGTSDELMLKALGRLGYSARSVRVVPGQTLAAWLKATPRPEGTVYLVSAGHHWQVISGRRYTCGRIREIVSVRDERVKRRARVKAAWKIEEMPR